MPQKGSHVERKQFGEKVKKTRLGKGMNAKACAAHLEISESHLYAIEGGRTAMSAAVRARLEGFVASPSRLETQAHNLIPLISVIAASGIPHLSLDGMRELQLAYQSCADHGIVFGTEQLEQVLKHLADEK